MKKLFVFLPVIILVAFLLNSFVPKEKEAKNRSINAGRSPGIANVIFRSIDGGQTWQNISEGLPGRLQREGIRTNGFFADNRGLSLRTRNAIYHSEPNSTTPYWTKEVFSGEQWNISPTKNGVLAYNFRGQFLEKADGANDWSPVFKNFQKQAVHIDSTKDWMYKNYKEREVRTVFETAKGTMLIGSGNCIFRSVNGGQTWTKEHVGEGRAKFAESKGVLLTTSKNGVWRSVDDGETWGRVMGEGEPGITVEPVSGGFAAITCNAITHTNSLHISLDGGKTWSSIGERLEPYRSNLFTGNLNSLKPSSDILSIKQMGEYLICGRSDGLFRSADMGKTWKQLPLPPEENYGFSLAVSGNVLYIIPNKGC